MDTPSTSSGPAAVPAAVVTVYRCPVCEVECASAEELEAHFEARLDCSAGAAAAMDLAAMGITICERCDVAIMGAMQYTADGWVHESCLSPEERAEIAQEGREWAEAILHPDSTDPVVTGTTGSRLKPELQTGAVA